MSVLMSMVLDGDGESLERFAAENPDRIKAIRDHAVEHGLIAHRFYATEGQIMVIDEWPDAASFQAFFAAEEAAIGPMMAQVATSEPEITFWRKLETGDDVGWE